MNELKTNFQQKGYLTVPNFISLETVEIMRDEIETLLALEKDATLKPTTLLKSSILSNIIFSSEFKNVLNKLSSDYQFYIPNFTARKNLYIGWHSDDEFVCGDNGELPKILQCNIYLQDNSIEHGGGIDVAIGTHLLSQDKKKCLITENNLTFESANTKAGDLLIFDYRVIHRSTIPAIAPRISSRLALQWTVGQTLDRARMFTEYLIRRQREKLHLSDFTDTRAIAYFIDAMNVEYPSSFQKETLDLIDKTKIIVPSVKEMLSAYE